MIPALMNWSVSPEPGCTTTATVSATSSTSVSDWPTPTVSTTTRSYAGASTSTASRVGAASPPSRVPAAVERIRTPSSRGSCSIRARSPSSDPPERFDEGSTASTATVRPALRHVDTRADSSDDLPAPGGPVTPTRCAPSDAPTSASSAEACSRPPGERSSMTLSAAGPARRSPAARRRPSSAASGCAGGDTRTLGHELDDIPHDLRQLEVLRRVDARHAGVEQRLLVGGRDDPAHHHRHVGAGLTQLGQDARDQLAVGAREDREADYVHALLYGRRGDPRGREPDALVDDVH